MKTYAKVLLGTVAVFAVGVMIVGSSYNHMNKLNENVNLSYGQYQNHLMRRADLIPNLANSAKGYMNSEQRTMIEVASARSGELAKLKPSDIANNTELQKKMLEAQAAQGRAMVALNAVREAYPQLKASGLVMNLMAELSGTENRVAVARGNTQRAVNEYNVAVQTFPRVFLARNLGFNPKPYFEAGAENQTAPKVNF